MARGNVRVSITGDASGLSRSVRQAETSLGGLQKSASRHIKTMAGLAVGVTGAEVALTKAATATVDFDRSMRNVNSIAQLSETRLKALDKQVLSLAGKTAQAPKTLADGLYDLVSSGFDAHESMTILASSAKAATAGLTTTEVSTKAVAAVLNAYHRPANDAAKVSDDLFQTVNKGVISFESLSETIGDVLPFAASLGVGLDQVGASVSTMTKAGINAPETMTRLKNVMTSLIKPSDDMGKAIKAAGFNSGEALIKAKGFQGALEALVGTTDGSKEAVAKLFPNIRALGGALALTGKNAKGAEADLRAFKDTSGATDKALSQQSQSISYQWNKLKATFSAWSITAGLALIDAGKAAKRFANDNREAINNVVSVFRTVWPGVKQALQGLVQGLRGMVKVITGILTLDLGRVVSGIGDIFGGALKDALGKVRAFTGPIRAAAGVLGRAFAAAIRGPIEKVKGFVDGVLHSTLSTLGLVSDKVDAIKPVHIPQLTLPDPAGHRIPPGKLASGGYISGRYSDGDRHTIRVAGEEVVLNPRQQAMIGRDRIFGALRATGGKVIGPGHGALSGGLVQAMNAVRSHFPLTVTSTTGGQHAPNSYHYRGEAVDLAGSPATMNAAAAWIGKNLGPYLAEGIHNPNLSIDNGRRVPSSFWGPATWAGHANHIHMAVTRSSIPKLGGRSVTRKVTAAAPKKRKRRLGIDVTGTEGQIPGIGHFTDGQLDPLPSYTPAIPPDDSGSGIGAEDAAQAAMLAALEENNRRLAEQNALLAQQAAERQKLLNVSQAQYKQLFAGFVDAISGNIGGRAGLGFMSPSFANGFARY